MKQCSVMSKLNYNIMLDFTQMDNSPSLSIGFCHPLLYLHGSLSGERESNPARQDPRSFHSRISKFGNRKVSQNWCSSHWKPLLQVSNLICVVMKAFEIIFLFIPLRSSKQFVDSFNFRRNIHESYDLKGSVRNRLATTGDKPDDRSAMQVQKNSKIIKRNKYRP